MGRCAKLLPRSRTGKVSIRSPHKSKGRHGGASRRLKSRKFQSAPLTKARGDGRPQPCSTSTSSFNPLPSQKQGETPKRNQHTTPTRFQSAPLTKARGDQFNARSLNCVTIRFNPLPSQKQGETSAWAAGGYADVRFNPLPSQKQGETSNFAMNFTEIQVSIRSPHKSKGRLAAMHTFKPRRMFQSAPLTKARGDSH